jgi:hypothetical protein
MIWNRIKEFLTDLLNIQFNLGKTANCPSKNIDINKVERLLKPNNEEKNNPSK